MRGKTVPARFYTLGKKTHRSFFPTTGKTGRDLPDSFPFFIRMPRWHDFGTGGVELKSDPCKFTFKKEP
jgi:hypothetical protein